MIKIKEKSECCGCGVCENICPQNCIKMIEDEEGFLYPDIEIQNCIECGLCEKTCPVIQCVSDEKKAQRAYLVQSRNDKVCRESTSGGAFTAIALSILHQNGVVFGAAFDEKFDVFHTYVEKEEELKKFRNSKYVQSRMGDCYQQVRTFLREGRKVLFSGTPCQVEGLYHFLQGNRNNLILVDTVCHAVPSPLVWRKYQEYCKPQKSSLLVAAAFRDKTKYGYQYSQMRMEYEDGFIRYCGVESDPYLRAFFSNLSDRPACYECQFKKRYRISDLTIWDCFDVYRMEKKFDNNKGVTRVLAHSSAGRKIMENLYQCEVVRIDEDLAVTGVKELVESVPMNEKRSRFFKDCRELKEEEFFQKWFPDNLKVKGDRLARQICEKMGVYQPMKRAIRIILGKE